MLKACIIKKKYRKSYYVCSEYDIFKGVMAAEGGWNKNITIYILNCSDC